MQNLSNTITRYRLIEEHLVGENKELLENYDLLSVIMLCLGGAGSENYDKEKGITKGRAEGVVEGTIRTLKQLGISKADAVKHIVNRNGMTPSEAEGQVATLWDTI